LHAFSFGRAAAPEWRQGIDLETDGALTRSAAYMYGVTGTHISLPAYRIWWLLQRKDPRGAGAALARGERACTTQTPAASDV